MALITTEQLSQPSIARLSLIPIGSSTPNVMRLVGQPAGCDVVHTHSVRLGV